MNDSALTCNIFKPGVEVITSAIIKSQGLPPFSSGVFSHYNMGKMNPEDDFTKGVVVITRRGKTGKPRLEVHSLTFPMYYIHAEQYTNLMADKSIAAKAVYLENDGVSFSNVMEYPDLKFLSWILAKTLYLKQLSDSTKHTFWPKAKDYALNVVLQMRQEYDGNEDLFRQTLCPADRRITLLESIRTSEAQLVSAGSNYMYSLFRHRCFQIDRLLNVVKCNKLNYVNVTSQEHKKLRGTD